MTNVLPLYRAEGSVRSSSISPAVPRRPVMPDGQSWKPYHDRIEHARKEQALGDEAESLQILSKPELVEDQVKQDARSNLDYDEYDPEDPRLAPFRAERERQRAGHEQSLKKLLAEHPELADHLKKLDQAAAEVARLQDEHIDRLEPEYGDMMQERYDEQVLADQEIDPEWIEAKARDLHENVTDAAQAVEQAQAVFNDTVYDLADHLAQFPEVAELPEFKQAAEFIRIQEAALAAELDRGLSLHERARQMADQMRRAVAESMKQSKAIKP